MHTEFVCCFVQEFWKNSESPTSRMVEARCLNEGKGLCSRYRICTLDNAGNINTYKKRHSNNLAGTASVPSQSAESMRKKIGKDHEAPFCTIDCKTHPEVFISLPAMVTYSLM